MFDTCIRWRVVAIELIAEHLRGKITRDCGGGIREKILQKAIQSQMPDSLVQLPVTNQIRVCTSATRCKYSY
jgi:hypothetical protein